MRKRGKDAAHFTLLVLITTFVLLITNIAVLVGFFARRKGDIPFHSKTMILENLTANEDGYQLSENVKELLIEEDIFAMILSQEGKIIWQERLPKELEKEYTIQDVASFTRWYLKDYPVRTYIIPEGLLVIGSGRHTTWKHTIEFNEEMFGSFLRHIPIILLIDIAILISVPLFIQRKWLRWREEERTEWIAGVSHDIRTPLTLILGSADYISQNPDDLSVTGKADSIRRQGLRIRALVANLNTSGTLDFGMGDYKKSPINVGSMIRKTVTDYLNRDPDDKYGFTLNIPDDLQNIMTAANEELFQRMLENIINNSIQHNPDGCEIGIRLVADKHRSNRYTLQISDNGQEASAETLKVLNHRSSNKAGKLAEHGIGLCLVKQIARFHSWKVSFSNNEPQGFIVTVKINCKRV